MKYHVEFDLDFKRNSSKGLYIAIEGIDGSGKTTQVEQLSEYFRKQGRKVVITREPRKDVGLIGNLIKEILLGNVKVPSIALQYLFTADRAMHHDELILPALKAGKVVISDRCFWSAIPYGIMDRGEAFNPKTGQFILIAQSILSMYHQFTIPDYTFYLETPFATAIKRLAQEGSPKEIYESRAQVKATMAGYEWLLQEFPKEFILINSQKPVAAVTEEIVSVIARSEA